MIKELEPVARNENPQTITAYIIDHSEAMQNSLEKMVQELGGIICGKSPDGTRSLEPLKVLQPDLILLDILVPGTSGVEVFSDIRQATPDSKTMILTTLSDRDMVLDCRRLGAFDYVLKPFEWGDLKNRLARLIRNMMAERQALSGSEPARLKMLFDKARGKVGSCCQHCGRNNPLENSFCGMCGRILHVMSPSSQVKRTPEQQSGSFFSDLINEARRDKTVFMACQTNLKQGDIQEIFDEGSQG
jgi:DNA-binding NarL/FixJ family response regulator